MLKFIMIVVMIQLFYSFGITLLAYSLPSSTLSLVNVYEQPSSELDMTEISETIETNIRTQLNIPFVDIGALVFYSGNVVIDMVVNFFTAIPSMLTIVLSSLFMIFPIESFVATQLKLLMWVFASILYFVAFLSFIMSIRSGTRGIV